MKIKTKSSFLIFSIIFILFDAYSINQIPFSWIGHLVLFIVYLYIFLSNSLNFKSKDFLFLLLLFTITIPSIVNVNLIDSTYFALRLFNIISFLIILYMSANENSNLVMQNNILGKLLFIFSFTGIYIYFAQIFDFYEPNRTRSSTSTSIFDSQATFWLSEPHRLMGTFREPSYYASLIFPVLFIYILNKKNVSNLIIFITSISIGLTRSDFARLFCFVLLLIEIIFWFKNKKLNFQLLYSVLIIFLFSSYGILECNVNPTSKECSEYSETVKIINSSGELKIKSNESNPISNLDNERITAIKFFINNLSNLSPVGISNVNKNFQKFIIDETSKEMYLTNRVLPKFLNTRYKTQSFGTGDYQALFNEYSVQNMIIFYTASLGSVFLLLIISIPIFIFNKFKITKNLAYLLTLVAFIVVSPFEEVNGLYGLLLGYTYNLLSKK